ncbi:hypothetical protein PBRA_003430, partial [Plasmodiophora brassicae]
MSDAGSDADSEFDLDNFLAAVDGSISVDFDACPNGWAPVNTSELACTLGIDDVDSFLLLHARKEQEKVMQRILQRLPGRIRSPKNVPAFQHIQIWLSSQVLSPMLAFINRFIDGLKVTGPELLAFVAMELDLAFYQCSPSRYFSSAKFVKRAGCPSHERYIAILKALGGRHKQRDVDEWEAPLTHDPDVAHVLDIVRRLCASIGFVPDWSIISADDDHLRLSSHAQVDAAGLQYQKNPVKGAGVVHHSMVSVTSGLYLGGHVAARNETVSDCMEVLSRSLSGASVASNAVIPNIIARDRGYNGDETRRTALAQGSDVVGTTKRSRSLPFTFGQVPGKSQTSISESGSRCAYWAVRRYDNGRQVYLLAYRTGIGRVVMCETTLPRAAPGTWTFVSCNRCDRPLAPSPHPLLSMFEAELILQLTISQRTPDWFLLRHFRITGTGSAASYCFIAKLARNDPDFEIDPETKRVLDLLAIQYGRPEADRGEGRADRTFTEEDLRAMTNDTLKDHCRAKGLRLGGKKEDLVKRLMEHGTGGSGCGQFRRIEAALMSTWFMAPLKKDHLKIGSLNETNVEHGIRQFVERHGSGLKVVCHKQYGLLCHRRQHEAAFSPDLVAVLHCPQRGAFLSGMEFKTRTSRDTLQTDEALSRVVGAFCRVNVSTDAALFRTAVPNRSYRGQLIHDMSCGGLDDWLFCISSTTRIIRVVHVQINVEDRACYLSSLSFIRERYLMWIYGDEPVPKFDEDEFGHAIDDVTVRQTLQLWRTVTAVVMERGQPLPKGKHILPSLVALWNRIKGGVDVYSRYLKNLHSRHSSLNPVQAIWLRIVMTLVYNAYQSHTMCQVNDFLTNEQACQTFHAYRRARKDQVSFGEFVEAISDEIPKLSVDVLHVGVPVAEDGESVGDDDRHGDITFAYNKREKFYQVPSLVAKRMNKRLKHQQSSLHGKRLTCLVCCSRVHDGTTPHLGRLGFKTSWACSVCDVPLCRKKRYNGSSCFELFHTRLEAYPCCDSAEVPSVQGHSNRAPPPTRRREDPQQPNHRSRTRSMSAD